MIVKQEIGYNRQKMNDLSIPVLQVRHDSAICYQYWTGPRRAPNDNLQYLASARALAYSGKMTTTTEKKVRKAIDLMLQASPSRIIYNTVSKTFHPFRIGFWTLTVSDQVIRPHAEVYQKCLAPFLDWLRYRKIMYIWKAELQQRGQIHYHLTCDQFCSYLDAAKQWNKLQRKAGYLTEYAKEHKHYNANSIDIHSVVNIRDIEAYLVKYVTKKDKLGRVINGKVWGCSSSLEGARFCTEIDASIEAKIQNTPKVETEYCTIVKCPGATLLSGQDLHNYSLFTQNLKV